MIPARLELATMFPPVVTRFSSMIKYKGALTTIRDIPFSCYNKGYIVKLCIRRNMEAVINDGKGTKAAKREAFIRCAMEEQHSRVVSRGRDGYAYANRVINPHD